MEQNLPAVIDPSYGVDTYRTATNAATLCGEIVKATAQNIQGRKYVRVEGWMALAAAHGCLVSISLVEAVEGGIRAVAELKRMADGLVLATAEGFVGDDEAMWAKRPLYARRAMAQTRASSRVCRSAFSHCVVLIDKDLGTTPAEEMQGLQDVPRDIHGHPHMAAAMEAQQLAGVDGPGSSWGPGGKASAVDEAERDGLTKNAPKVTDAKRKQFETWHKNAVGTLKLSGQTPDSLDTLWDSPDWQQKRGTLEEYAPDLFKTLKEAYDKARENAVEMAA